MINGLIGATIVSPPRWLADFSDPEIAIEHFPAKIDPTQFVDFNAMYFNVNGAAAQNATVINLVSAPAFPPTWTLLAQIPKGTWLDFGGAKVAQLSAAYTGGLTLAVNAIPTALVGGEQAYYLPYGQRVQVPSGTLLGRTFAQRAAGANFGPATLTSDEFYLMLHDVYNANLNNNCELVRNGRTVKENYLPQYASLLSVPVNAVQTYTNTGTLSAGNFSLYSFDTGITTELAYNGNLAAIQAAYDTLFGATNTVVAGTIASYSVTYGSGAGTTYADKPVQLVRVDGANVTGFTGGTAQTTVVGGNGTGLLALVRSKYRTTIGVN